MKPVTHEELAELQKSRWKYTKQHQHGDLSVGYEHGQIDKELAERILHTLEADNSLFCVMTGVGFGFGAIGVRIYKEEMYIGTGAEFLFLFSEKHLKKKEYKWVGEPTHGNVSDAAWDFFSVAVTERHLQRAAYYKLRVPSRGDMCY